MTKPWQQPLELRGPPVIGSVERTLVRSGVRWIIGVDEAGRGPLAGPVAVGAVLLDLQELAWTGGLDDSKRLKESAREAAFDVVLTHAPAHSCEFVAPDEIDRLNILWASMEGMRRCVETLRTLHVEALSAEVLVDGNRPIPGLEGPQRCLVKGDARSLAIAAASVIAKVSRDREMRRIDVQYPGYGFGAHKGYPTSQHLRALETLGVTPHHRTTFSPVARALAAQSGAES